jgi:SsrA-binding protein
VIAQNRRARFDYHVEDSVEAGIQLTGTEVKSLREGSAQLSDAYAVGQRGELMLLNAQIPPYKPAGPLQNHEPKRTRKLLLHRREIDRLLEKQQKAGYALIPLSLYFKDGRAKVEIGLCRGKQTVDKREAIAEREAKREMERARRR